MKIIVLVLSILFISTSSFSETISVTEKMNKEIVLILESDKMSDFLQKERKINYMTQISLFQMGNDGINSYKLNFTAGHEFTRYTCFVLVTVDVASKSDAMTFSPLECTVLNDDVLVDDRIIPANN